MVGCLFGCGFITVLVNSVVVDCASSIRCDCLVSLLYLVGMLCGWLGLVGYASGLVGQLWWCASSWVVCMLVACCVFAHSVVGGLRVCCFCCALLLVVVLWLVHVCMWLLWW